MNNERYNDNAPPKGDWIMNTDFAQKVYVPPRTTEENKKFQCQSFGKRGIGITLNDVAPLMLSDVRPDNQQSSSKLPR